MNIYISVILTLLTIITGVLTIVSFINGRKKESNADSKQNGKTEQKIDDIGSRVELIQKDVQEIRNSEQKIMQLAIEALASAKSAHKRIDALENRINKS